MIINPQDPLGIIGFVYFGPAIYTGWRIMFHGIFSIGLFKWYNPLRWIIPIGAIVSAILLPYFLFDSVRRHFFDRARVVVVGPIPTKISLLLWSLVSVAISAILAIWLLSRVHFTNLQDIDSMRFKVMLRVFLEGLHIVPAAIFFLYVASEVRSVYVHKLWRVCDPKVLSVRNVGLTTKPPTNDRSSKLVKIAHLSDLHITSTYRSMCIDRSGPGGNKALAKLIRELQLNLLGVDAILITGDVTDTGAPREWKYFLRLIPASLLDKIVLVPGNHDFNMAFCFGIDWDRKVRYLKQIRWLLALDIIQGERTYTLNDEGDLIPFRPWLLQFMPAIKEFVRNPPVVWYDEWGLYRQTQTYKLLRHVIETLESTFPLVVMIGKTESFVVILDSNDVSSNLVTNAFGRVSLTQLKRLERFLSSTSKRPLAITLHHHLVPASRDKGIMNWLKQGPLGLVNVPALIKTLRPAGDCVVFAGHQHKYDLSLVGENCTVVSAPSSTLGDGGGKIASHSTGFAVYTVDWSDSLGTRLISEKWLTLHT